MATTSSGQRLSGTWSVPPSSFDDWIERMGELADFMHSHQFDIGDGVILGESEYGEGVWKAIERLGYARGSVRNIVRVCQAIPPNERNPQLRYSHHVVVYKLSKKDQQYWLERAESHGWKVREFRVKVHGPPGAKGRRKFGDRLDFRGLLYEPTEELGVVFLFGMVAEELGFQVEGIRGSFPDCRAKRKMKDGGLEEVDIEFEFKASNFKRRAGHDEKYCDLIVCWEDDWPARPPELDVIELKREIKRLAQ